MYQLNKNILTVQIFVFHGPHLDHLDKKAQIIEFNDNSTKIKKITYYIYTELGNDIVKNYNLMRKI